MSDTTRSGDERQKLKSLYFALASGDEFVARRLNRATKRSYSSQEWAHLLEPAVQKHFGEVLRQAFSTYHGQLH